VHEELYDADCRVSDDAMNMMQECSKHRTEDKWNVGFSLVDMTRMCMVDRMGPTPGEVWHQ